MNRSRHSPDERRPLLESPTATSTSRYGSNAVAVSVESGGDSSTLETSSVDDADGGSLRPITFGSDEVSKSFFEKRSSFEFGEHLPSKHARQLMQPTLNNAQIPQQADYTSDI